MAVGNGGTILTSPNGVTWTARTSGTPDFLNGVGYGGSQFVVVGFTGTILTSPDGVTWTADAPGTTQPLYGVAYDGSQFVVVGDNGTILTSGGGGSSTLGLTKSVSPSSAKPGDSITYTIAFSNTGAITATSVLITDTLSANITGANYTSSGVALTLVSGQTYAWTAPDLAQNQGGVITITGVLTKPLVAGMFTNTVTLAVSGTVKTADAPLTVQNVAPVAHAGVDQSKGVSSTVTLDGRGSTDDNGDALIYGWAQTGGPAVTFTPNLSVITFTAPATSAVLTFTLTVTDTGALTGTDEVVITVTSGTPGYASAPVAGSTIDVGKVKVGSPVTATLTISETGNATLNVSHSLGGANAADFSVSPETLSIPDGGAAQSLSIRCVPGGFGLRTATLTVNHNAAGSPATYTLNCTGQLIMYVPMVIRN